MASACACVVCVHAHMYVCKCMHVRRPAVDQYLFFKSISPFLLNYISWILLAQLVSLPWGSQLLLNIGITGRSPHPPGLSVGAGELRSLRLYSEHFSHQLTSLAPEATSDMKTALCGYVHIIELRCSRHL